MSEQLVAAVLSKVSPLVIFPLYFVASAARIYFRISEVRSYCKRVVHEDIPSEEFKPYFKNVPWYCAHIVAEYADAIFKANGTNMKQFCKLDEIYAKHLDNWATSAADVLFPFVIRETRNIFPSEEEKTD